ncbi:hypothetical protein DV707_10790 [Halobellus limi]|nr:hypothetical protein DV707_10790 [Halobellus limi]
MNSPDFERMVRLNRWGLRDITMNPRDVHAPFPYVGFKTFDRKGKVAGMEKWLYSPAWESGPWGPGRRESLEIRNATGGGTRIRGEVFVGFDNDDIRFNYVEIDTTVPFTPSELVAIIEGEPGEYPHPANENRTIDSEKARELIDEELFWAEQDAIEAAVEAVYEYREECEHTHTVEFESPKIGMTVCRASGYCEDCGVEFEAVL